MRTNLYKGIRLQGICSSLSTHKGALAPIPCVHRCHFLYLPDGLNCVCPSLPMCYFLYPQLDQ
jgi:hypothetical protein